MKENLEIDFLFTFADKSEIRFTSINELSDWYKNEQNFWIWLNEVKFIQSPHKQQIGVLKDRLKEIFGLCISAITEISNNNIASTKDKWKENLQNKFRKYFPSISPQCEYIKGIKVGDPLLAAYVAASFYNIEIAPVTYQSLEGAFLKFAFTHPKNGYSSAVEESLQNLYVKFNEILNETKVKQNSFCNELEELTKKYTEQTESQDVVFENFIESSNTTFNDMLKKEKEELENISRTYDEKLALQASVKYWQTKANNHDNETKKLKWYIIIVFVASTILLCAETYFVVGPNNKISDVPIWKFSMLLLTAIFGIWTIRILVRLMFSNFHLRSDAVERRTMLLTYLSLLRKGQGPTDEQRELILSILFRPASTGIIKDDALPPIVSQWMKQITN